MTDMMSSFIDIFRIFTSEYEDRSLKHVLFQHSLKLVNIELYQHCYFFRVFTKFDVNEGFQ